MKDIQQAISFAIEQAKGHDRTEVGVDELLLGGLQAISQFGIVTLGAAVLDLELLGVDWVRQPDKQKRKVRYSAAAVKLFDRAAQIARSDGNRRMCTEHLLAAFAGEDAGLMGRLKLEHGVTSTGWRAALVELAAPAVPAGAAVEEPSHASAASTRDYLTPEEASEALGLHVQTVRGYVRSGKLPAMRLAGERSIRIRRTDLEAVLEPTLP